MTLQAQRSETQIVKIGEAIPPRDTVSSARLAQPPRILVVDDAETIRFCVSRALTDEGFDVVEADRAKAALVALRAQTIDLMLLDLGLPDMDGLDVLEVVSKELPELNVIVFSVRNDRKTVKLAQDLGAIDHISKPFDIDDVIETISKQFE